MNDLFQLIRLKENQNLRVLFSSIDINILNENSQNLLHEAIAFSNDEILEDLIKYGIQLNQQDYNGQTPLHYAAAHSNLVAVKMLLSNGSDTNICDNYGNTPLWTATFNARGKYDIVRLIRAAGGNPENKNKHGKSAVDFAVQINDKQLENILRE